MKKLSYILLAIVFAFSSCSKNVEGIKSSKEMTFSVCYPTTKATETDFEINDVFGAYITEYDGENPSLLQLGGNYVNNVPVKYNGTSWTATPTIYWGEGKYDVYAYYPYGQPGSITEMSFDVATDQREDADIEGTSQYEASDFLWSTAKEVTSSEPTVKLLFKHKMSKVTVNLVKGENFEGEIPEKASVIIHNTVASSLIDLSTGDVVKDPHTAASSIFARQVGRGKYSAIVVPQTLTNKVPLIEVICNGVSYLFESKFQFKSGMNHTIDYILDDNPEKVKIEIGGEIDNW